MKNNFCVIDIETKGLSARPESFVFACMYADHGKSKKVFYEREAMVSYLFSKKNPYRYIFAHNAEFDFTILFDNIILHLDRSALFVGSTFVQAKKDGKIFSNSLPILKSSVAELGKNLGIEKMELDNKFKEGDENIIVNEKDVEYCYRDCEIVYVFLDKIFQYTGKIKPTIASCAMHVFTKNFLQRPLNNNPYNEKFRDSYYGGRVECFRFGTISPCNYYDINSLYPRAAIDAFFPDFNKLKKGGNHDVKRFENSILSNYEGCATVTVEHKKNFVGVLPFRRNHEIIYPCGVWTACYNFNELRFALSTGLVKILEVKNYYYAPRIQFTELREYMLHFYKLKNETEGAEKLMYKFFLNALTGKFAQKEYGEKTYFETVEEMFGYIDENNVKKYTTQHFSKDRKDVFLEVFREKKEKKVNWNLPTISSYITSQARIIMLPFFLKYQKNILYTDTDSLVLDCPLPEKYVSETILGMFKREGNTEITIHGNKHYRSKVKKKNKTSTVYHIKGVGKNFKRRGKNFRFNKMIRTKEALKRRDKLHAGMFVEVVKHLSPDYTKRKVNGLQTQTLKINE